MKITQYFKNFFNRSEASGIILILCVLLSLIIANSNVAESFQHFLKSEIGPYSFSEWVNDGLMTIFFLLVALEIKREIVKGELSNFKKASLPIFAAIGGMLVPALIYFLFNHGTGYQHGWGIPMATDIAFSLAIITMLGDRVPVSLKIFLAALAIVDDLGAIVVIAVFYSGGLVWINLLICLLIVILLFVLNKKKVQNLWFYLIPGIALWYFMHHSGVHATIAGVLLAFTIPTEALKKGLVSPLEKLESAIEVPVNFFIMPIFAIVNTDITFGSGMVDGLFTSLGGGIIGGLVLGKLLGVFLTCFILVKLGVSKLPSKATWSHMIGVGLLAGIGFTMSIFVSLLSFKGNIAFQDEAKFSILVASTLAGILGYSYLKFLSMSQHKNKL